MKINIKIPNPEDFAKSIYEAHSDLREIEEGDGFCPEWGELDNVTKSAEVALTEKLLTAHLNDTRIDYRLVLNSYVEVTKIQVDFDLDDPMDTPSSIWEYVSVYRILFNLAIKSFYANL